ncbi:cupin domain-containing protein [Neobacillus pocheonensis]|uniref:cupin domain-containing protein n=1 Tax=Neobacillus pocheonensis TaxID=363869 RepID=UPI003D292ABC
MFHTSEENNEYRYVTHGPKYLTKGPNVDIGVVLLKPGDDHDNHYHTTCEEIFYILEGEIDIYINGEPVHVKPGDMLQVRPMEAHYLKNTNTVDFKAVFIKSPHISERDSVTVENPKMKE